MKIRNVVFAALLLAVALPASGCARRVSRCGASCAPACAVASTPCEPAPCAPVVAVDACSDTPTPPPDDRPPSANPGEAWCRVWIPAQFEEKTESVCVRPASKQKKWVAPVYGTRVKLECVTGPKISEKTQPAQFAARERQIRVPGKTRCVCTKDACGCPQRSQVTDPDSFRTECERLCLEPERTCFEFKPAQYRAVEERFVISPGFCQEICVAPSYESRSTRVCIKPGRWEWRRNENCEVPIEKPLAALQVELVDQNEAGVEAGIFSVGETVRYRLRVAHDDGSEAMANLRVVFQLPPELKFISGGGDGVSVQGTSQEARTGHFRLNVGETKTLQVMAQVVSVSPSNMVQMIASVQSEDGQEMARETESTTVK